MLKPSEPQQTLPIGTRHDPRPVVDSLRVNVPRIKTPLIGRRRAVALLAAFGLTLGLAAATNRIAARAPRPATRVPAVAPMTAATPARRATSLDFSVRASPSVNEVRMRRTAGIDPAR